MAQSSHASGPKLRLVAPATPPATHRADRPPSAAPLDDNELLEAVRSGDAAAAAAFYRRVRPSVDATIGRLLGRHDAEVDDVTQVALIELVRSIDRFRGECSLDTWIARVTAHVVCKQIRRRSFERGLFDRDAADPADESPLGARIAARDVLQRVRHHLEGMDQGKALAFLLHDACGFDLREVAKMLDVSVAAAQKRLVRGRRELRERIDSDPELADLLTERGGTT
jgi:RNA polymerase sigma-70 factor (ECF subfamily)